MTTHETAQRYPLSWPEGWKRTERHKRKRSNFRSRGRELTVSEAITRLSGELDRLGAAATILSTNVETRLDGLPRSGQSEPSDAGAAVYFKLKGQPRCLACDTWVKVAENIAAIAQHIDALRRIDRYGVGTMEQAFAGYAALPAQATASDWARVLKVRETATREEILSAHRVLAMEHHPDKGGDATLMSLINAARDAALKARA